MNKEPYTYSTTMSDAYIGPTHDKDIDTIVYYAPQPLFTDAHRVVDAEIVHTGEFDMVKANWLPKHRAEGQHRKYLTIAMVIIAIGCFVMFAGMILVATP